MTIVQRLSLLLAAGAVLVPAASSHASSMVHGSICRPSGDNGNPQPYTAHTGGFETSANMDITCAAPVDNVAVANPIWRILVQKSTAANMTCTGDGGLGRANHRQHVCCRAIELVRVRVPVRQRSPGENRSDSGILEMNRWVLSIAGCVFVGAAYWAGGWMAPSGAAQPSSPTPKAAARQSGVESLQQRLTALETFGRLQQAALPETAPAERAGPDSDADGENETDYPTDAVRGVRESHDDHLAQERRAAEQFYSELDQKFQAQPVDGAWRREAQSALSSALSSVGTYNVRLEGSDCRTDLCKTTLTHDARRPTQQMLVAMVDATASHLDHSFQYMDGRTIIYSIRRKEAPAGPLAGNEGER